MDESKVLQHWKTLSSEEALSTPWFLITKQYLQTPGGAQPTYYVHHSDDSVICVFVNKAGQLLLEKQYRPAIHKVSIDFPSGKMEADDHDAEASMARELQEETGYINAKFSKLGVLDKDPGFSSSKLHVFLAEDATASQAAPEDTESIVMMWVSQAEIIQMINNGNLSCVFCLSAYFLALKKLGWQL